MSKDGSSGKQIVDVTFRHYRVPCGQWQLSFLRAVAVGAIALRDSPNTYAEVDAIEFLALRLKDIDLEVLFVDTEHDQPAKLADQPVRYYRGHSSWHPSEYGGATECVVVYLDTNGDEQVVTHREPCHKNNRFCYATGRKIAFGRALKRIGVDPAGETWHKEQKKKDPNRVIVSVSV